MKQNKLQKSIILALVSLILCASCSFGDDAPVTGPTPPPPFINTNPHDIDFKNAQDVLTIQTIFGKNDNTIELEQFIYDRIQLDWSSSNPSVIDIQTRNVNHQEEDVKVKVTATIKSPFGNLETATKSFDVLVVGKNTTQSDDDVLNVVASKLYYHPRFSRLYNDFIKLPKSIVEDGRTVNITYKELSDNNNKVEITKDGKLKVYRDFFDVNAQIEATLTCNGKSKTKIINIKEQKMYEYKHDNYASEKIGAKSEYISFDKFEKEFMFGDSQAYDLPTELAYPILQNTTPSENPNIRWLYTNSTFNYQLKDKAKDELKIKQISSQSNIQWIQNMAYTPEERINALISVLDILKEYEKLEKNPTYDSFYNSYYNAFKNNKKYEQLDNSKYYTDYIMVTTFGNETYPTEKAIRKAFNEGNLDVQLIKNHILEIKKELSVNLGENATWDDIYNQQKEYVKENFKAIEGTVKYTIKDEDISIEGVYDKALPWYKQLGSFVSEDGTGLSFQYDSTFRFLQLISGGNTISLPIKFTKDYKTFTVLKTPNKTTEYDGLTSSDVTFDANTKALSFTLGGKSYNFIFTPQSFMQVVGGSVDF